MIAKEEKNDPNNKEAKVSNTNLVITSLLAGAVAGGIAKTAIAPFDRTKISFQINKEPYTTKAALYYLKNVIETSGVPGLWRGNSATMARILPYAAIQFTAHEQFKRLLKSDQKSVTNFSDRQKQCRRFLAGALAGLTSQSATYPLDLARAQMAVTFDAEYSSLKKVFFKILREEGVKGLYKGYLPTVLGVIPYAGASFYTYESLKIWYLGVLGDPEPHTFVLLVFGAASGFAAQSLSYPLDIVRRRMQTSTITKQEYNTIRSTVAYIYRTEGIMKGFYKGLSMNWIKGPIAVGLSFATYDKTKNFLRHYLLM